MSKTPETDAAANPHHCECDAGTVVNVITARRLETQRDEARADAVDAARTTERYRIALQNIRALIRPLDV